MSSTNVRQNKTPSLIRKASKPNNRQGLFSLNEKELRSELKRIDLSRRQYETLYSHEQRKVITRFATKLIRSSSTLESIINQESGCSTPSFQRVPSSVYEPRPSIKSLLKSGDNFSETSQDSRKPSKKSVKWNPELFSKEASEYTDISTLSLTSTQKSRPSFYEINKKYDELRLTLSNPPPKVMLPQLISANRRSNSDLNGFKQNNSIYIDVHKSTLENKNKFLHALENEESGFQTYQNCLGYDNFRNLLSSSSNVATRDNGDSVKNKGFQNPFHQVDFTPPHTPVIKNVTFKDEEFKRSTPDLRRDLLLERKKDDDDKMCLDTFRAQNIRSLTFKQITTY